MLTKFHIFDFQSIRINALFIAFAFAVCFSITIQTPAAPGNLDPSFGNGGKVTSAGFFGRAIAIQSDGKIVAAGNGLERYNADGSLDTSFGTGGRVVLPGSDFGCGGSACHFDPFSATAVAIQADGKIIAAGTGSIYDRDGDTWLYVAFSLWKYNIDGSLDESFGSGGKVVTLFGGGEGSPRAVAIQSDGKIVAAGYKRDNSWDFLTVRYNTNGTLDNSFGSGGKVVTSFGGIADEANDVAIQADGKIVVAGGNRTGTFQTIPSTTNFALARYNTDGSFDTSFGSGGKVVTPFDDNLFGADAVGIQSDGKIIAAGNGSDGTSRGFALARYNTNGSLDTFFGTGGKVVTPFGNYSYAYAVAIQSDGKIIAAGNTDSGIALARYNNNGSLDTSFGINGNVVTSLSNDAGAESVAIQSDGKIVVLAVNRYSFTTNVYALFRYQGRTESNFTVTRSDDRNNGVCVPGDCSLREAVNAANASATDDTINFASDLTTITLTAEIVINNAGTLSINGTGANVLTIDGGAGTNRIFYTNQATMTVSGLTLTGGNTDPAGLPPSNSGGAIYAVLGSLTLDGVYITGNSSSYGGGIYFNGGTHRVINSTFSANNGSEEGGGIKNSASLMIVNSTISGNTSYNAGGIFGEGGTLTLRNSTITGNSNGGISADRTTVNFGNTIVAGNTNTLSPGYAPEFNCFCTITSAGGNLIGDSTGDSTSTGLVSIAYQPTDIRDTNPMLGALQNNGGSTPTHALLTGSLAIDKGLNSLAVGPFNNSILQTDQRGFARIIGSAIDIGAFEFVSAKSRKRVRFF